MAPQNCRDLKIPVNLDLKEFTLKNPFQKNTGLLSDKIAFICDTIYHLKDKQQKNIKQQQGYVFINSNILRTYIHDYYKIIKYLTENGVLICNNSYQVNVKSKAYKFSEIYDISPQAYRLFSAKFARHISNVFEKLKQRKAVRQKKALHFHKWFNESLNLNKIEAQQWIADYYSTSILELENSWLNNRKYKNRIKELNSEVEDYRNFIITFDERKYHHKVDGTSFRFHSILTSLPKVFRGFLSYDDQALFALDIKSSQPYFSLILFESSFYNTRLSKGTVSLKKIYPELYKTLLGTENIKELKTKIIELNKVGNASKNFEDFKVEVLYKDIYQRIGSAIKAQLGINLCRGKLKKLLLFLIFNKWGITNQAGSYYHRIFKELYPTIDKLFAIFKRRQQRDLAVLLQRIESELIICRIGKKFSILFPDAPIYSIHDCLITTEKYKDDLNSLMISELSKWTGNKPRIQETKWDT